MFWLKAWKESILVHTARFNKHIALPSGVLWPLIERRSLKTRGRSIFWCADFRIVFREGVLQLVVFKIRPKYDGLSCMLEYLSPHFSEKTTALMTAQVEWVREKCKGGYEYFCKILGIVETHAMLDGCPFRGCTQVFCNFARTTHPRFKTLRSTAGRTKGKFSSKVFSKIKWKCSTNAIS